MHELSVLENIVKTCRRVAEENKVANIKIITLSVGELSGYIPFFFTEYFPIITKDEELFSGTELKLIQTPGEALCCNCHSMYNVMKNEGKCPKCGSREKSILGGQDLRIEELIV